ncbi:DUF4174 domain-containing protein [Nereida sp. MMG025]|uniref:DUF4174 domain-containing protein n=1 Tax=Nereida sp. MMG025 TaxID=2909981 RepID=UPI001F39C49D|nr:DUF4174 domain-containing protein [Nereida sp. MMG025]MCF6443913.1 DUF4174 domain-containing protein [Nereida sp. MMG025]
MKRFLPLALTALMLSFSAAKADTVLTPLEEWRADRAVVLATDEVTLDDFKWIARPIVVFADTPNDPRFIQQMDLLNARLDDLAARDVVIMVDTDPDAQSLLRTKLRPRGFMLALIGKDGGVKLRKPFPWDVRELTRTIDKMPLRKQEIKDSLGRQ